MNSLSDVLDFLGVAVWQTLSFSHKKQQNKKVVNPITINWYEYHPSMKWSQLQILTLVRDKPSMESWAGKYVTPKMEVVWHIFCLWFYKLNRMHSLDTMSTWLQRKKTFMIPPLPQNIQSSAEPPKHIWPVVLLHWRSVLLIFIKEKWCPSFPHNNVFSSWQLGENNNK